MKIETDNRIPVLIASLHLETNLSQFLQLILGIKATKKTQSFGNTSQALSLNSKVNLLLDLEILDKELQHWKLKAFMEIRNQFMHNGGASTYAECIAACSNVPKEKLLKEYPKEVSDTTEELIFKRAVGGLCKDTMNIVNGVLQSVLEKEILDHQLEKQNELYNVFLGTIREWGNKRKGESIDINQYMELMVEVTKELKENPPQGLKEKAKELAEKLFKEQFKPPFP